MSCCSLGIRTSAATGLFNAASDWADSCVIIRRQRERGGASDEFFDLTACNFMNWELQLTRPVRTRHSGLPKIIRTLGDAVDMIDEHLPESLRISPVWQQVKDILVTAAETRKGHDVETATALLERALEDEGLSPPETQPRT